MSDDPFMAGQEQSRLIREELRALRADVETMVRSEVERMGYPRRDVESMVREMVARELAGQRRSARAALEYWLPGIAALAAVLLLALGWLGWRTLRPTSTVSSPSAASAAAGADPAAGGAAPAADPAAAEDGAAAVLGAVEVDTPAPLSPAERAAVYDSLLRAGSPELEPLVTRLAAASTDPEVRAAIAGWRGRTANAAQFGRLHAALVQLVLREEARPGLVLDGAILRDPCRGDTCGALLEVWRVRGDSLGLPPFPAGGVPAAEPLGVAERVLVLSRIRPERP